MRSVESINKLAAEVNLKLNNINERFNTRRAHLCGYYAKDKGLYEQYALEMFKTYFEYKKNVYLPHIIDEIAIKIGLDPIEMDRLVDSGLYDERLAEDYKTGKRYGISSVPTFIINDKIKIAGVRQYEDFKKFFTDEFMNSL